MEGRNQGQIVVIVGTPRGHGKTLLADKRIREQLKTIERAQVEWRTKTFPEAIEQLGKAAGKAAEKFRDFNRAINCVNLTPHKQRQPEAWQGKGKRRKPKGSFK